MIYLNQSKIGNKAPFSQRRSDKLVIEKLEILGFNGLLKRHSYIIFMLNNC